jgi:hypothetical protein
MTAGNHNDYGLERGNRRFPVAAGGLHLGRTPISKLRLSIAALAVGLVTVAPALSAPAIPNPLSPSGDALDRTPAFAWDGVTGAVRYEFQVSADPGFNSTQASFFTKNTRASLTNTLTNGTYWWRVRADDGAGNVSGWSNPLSFTKEWGSAPVLTAPANGATVVFPDTPLTLKWNAVPLAAEYKLEVASDVSFSESSLVSTNFPLETQALQYTVPEALANGTYYWAVTPIDAKGNVGTTSTVRSFVWSWPYTPENTAVSDLVAAPEFYDPQFSWDPVPGAVRYEVEVSSAEASVVYSGTTIATSFSPKEVFDDNVYNWRVRGIDSADHTGDWADGPQFERAFDKAAPSIVNLHMHDYLVDAPATDDDLGTPGFQTQLPIIAWDPVPGASSYEVQVAPFSGACNYNAVIFDDVTASTSWTPLGKNPTDEPFPSPGLVGVAKETAELTAGNSYCVRVRARSAHVASSLTIWGAFKFLNDGTGAAFTWTGYPSTSPCSESCTAGYLGSDDYLLPDRASTVTRMPLLTWEPVDGAQSYWVIVAKDSNFGTIVDYAFTRFPAYAPRKRSLTSVRTYSDEQTAYYWAVLPSPAVNGDFSAYDPLEAAASSFEKQSVPPSPVAPGSGASVADQPTFQWTEAEGARLYRLQVSTDVNFGSVDVIDDVKTASTAYSTDETYPADTVLYWRVQAQNENQTGLTWSTPRTFEKTLAAPTVDPSNPTAGDLIPTFGWEPVQGAESYDLHLQLPDGSWSRDATDVAPSAVTAIEMTGTGVFQWQVRANYPKDFGVVHGPYSPIQSFTRTIHEPTGAAVDAGQNRLLVSWNAKTGAKQYKVQISARSDFSPYVEATTTDNTGFASLFSSSPYAAGGTFYWRVAAVDADRNQGDWTAAQSFSLPPLTTASSSTGGDKTFLLSSQGRLVKNRYRTVYIYAKDASTLGGVQNAVVRASGAGVTLTLKLTNSNGVASFRLKPTKLRRVEFRVSKSGYTTKSLYKKVVAP